MSISLAKNAFRRNKSFLRKLLVTDAPEKFKLDQARALLCFLHHLVNGRIPIKKDSLSKLRRGYGLRKLRDDLEKRHKFRSLLYSKDLDKFNKYLSNFKPYWKSLLKVLFEKPS